MRLRAVTTFLAGVAFTFGMMILIGAGGTVKSPTGTAPDRYAYYPGTEDLDKDEIRLIACGTGLPSARRDQAATCFLADRAGGSAARQHLDPARDQLTPPLARDVAEHGRLLGVVEDEDHGPHLRLVALEAEFFQRFASVGKP